MLSLMARFLPVNSMRRFKSFAALVTLGSIAFIAGCGGGGGAGSPSPQPSTSQAPPPSKTLASISIAPAGSSLVAGLTSQFSATGVYSDGSTSDISASVSWTSSTPSTAAISAGGLATGVHAGPTTITATSGGIVGSTTLTVTAPTLVSIGVTPAAPTIARGSTQQFIAVGKYSDNSTQVLTTTVTWTSSVSATAAISNASGFNGQASAVAVGTTVITASLSGVTSPPVTLSVTPATLVSIAVTPATPSIMNGTTLQFTAIGTYTDATTQVITTTVMWNSATPATATISNAAGSNGLATALAVGNTSITASVGGITSPAPGDTLTVTPAEYLYATDINNGQVDQYIIGSGGALVPMATPTVASGSQPTGLAVDPTRHFLYVANFGSATVSQYTIGATGGLTPMSPATVAADTRANSVTIDASGTHAYVPNAGVPNGSISQYTITPGTGILVPMTPASVPAPAGAAVMKINKAGTFAYVTNYDSNSISLFSITGGALTHVSDTPLAGLNPNVLTFDSTGAYLYVADSGNDTAHGIGQFAVDPTTGALSPLAPSYISQRAHTVTLLHLGTTDYVYAVNDNAATIAQYAVNPATGDLGTILGVASVGAGPISISFDPTSSYGYSANEHGNSISQFSVGSNGALTPLSVPAVSPPSGTLGAAMPVFIATSTAY